MVEARVPVGGPGTGLLDQPQQLDAAGAQGRLPRARLEQRQPDRAPVVGERALQVGHGQVDSADARGRVDGGAQATTRYTWNTSAYSRFTLMPCVRATFQTYSAFA